MLKRRDRPRFVGKDIEMNRVRTAKEISRTAFLRLEELLNDMEWSEEVAKIEFVREIAEPLGHHPKSVICWWERGEIPSAQIFNVSAVLGIAPGWLIGQSHLTKAQAVVPGGLYHREMDRALRHRNRSA